MENIAIEGSPFVARRRGDNWFVTMGNHKISGILRSEEECRNVVEAAPWDMILMCMQALIDTNKMFDAQLVKEQSKTEIKN